MQESPLIPNAIKMMNKNWKEMSMSRRTTPIHLNQRTKKKMRKAYKSICDKVIQKRTSLYRNGE